MSALGRPNYVRIVWRHTGIGVVACIPTDPCTTLPCAATCAGARAALEDRGQKQTSGVMLGGLPIHSFRMLLADLATGRHTVATPTNQLYPLTVVARPTPVQQNAFDLLGVAV
jgi:hypothetical protein